MSFSQAADDWVTRTLNYPIANWRRLAAARRRVAAASRSFPSLSENLGILDQASVLRATEEALRRQIGGLGAADADLAENLATTYEQHVERAQDAFDAEHQRRQTIIIPLLEQATVSLGSRPRPTSLSRPSRVRRAQTPGLSANRAEWPNCGCPRHCTVFSRS